MIKEKSSRMLMFQKIGSSGIIGSLCLLIATLGIVACREDITPSRNEERSPEEMSSMKESEVSIPPAISYKEGSSEFSLIWKDTVWEGLTCGVKVNGKWLSASDFPQREWRDGKLRNSEGFVADTLTCKGVGPLKYFKVEFQHSSAKPYMILRASAEAAEECEIGGFRLLTSSEKALPALSGTAKNWMLYGDKINALWIGQLIRLDKFTEPLQGCWVSSLQNPYINETFAFASLTAELWPTWFEWTPASEGSTQLSLTIRAGGETDKESILVQPNTEIVSDAVLVGHWKDIQPQKVLMLIGDMQANKNRTKPPRRHIPGWCSWFYHFSDVTEEDILRAADFMEERLAKYGYRLVQLDGGWWKMRGDWEPNEKFPNGLRWLSDKLHEKGLLFGLHMSPFRIDLDSEFAKAHPDWFIRDLETGELITERGRGQRAILDGSNQEVVKWMSELFSKMEREWKVDFFKLDFLTRGASEGLRHDPSMTGLQAYNKAMRAIREAIPEEITILGCNALSLGASEAFDTVRVGVDISKPSLGHVGPHGEHAIMRWGPPEGPVSIELDGKRKISYTQTLTAQVRAVARQFYTHGRLYVNDPDCVLVTPDYNLEEARAHMTFVALTGGALFLTDRLDTLPEDRLGLLTNARVLDIWREGNHALPLDLFTIEELPRIWRVDRPSGTVVIAIFNWKDDLDRKIWTLQELNLDEAEQYKVIDLWSDKVVELENNKLSLKQAKHSVRLLEFHKASEPTS